MLPNLSNLRLDDDDATTAVRPRPDWVDDRDGAPSSVADLPPSSSIARRRGRPVRPATPARPARPLSRAGDRNRVAIRTQGVGRTPRSTRSRGAPAPSRTVSEIRREEAEGPGGPVFRLQRSIYSHPPTLAVYCYTKNWDKIMQAPPRGIAPMTLLERNSDSYLLGLPAKMCAAFFFFAEASDLMRFGLTPRIIDQIIVEVRDADTALRERQQTAVTLYENVLVEEPGYESMYFSPLILASEDIDVFWDSYDPEELGKPYPKTDEEKLAYDESIEDGSHWTAQIFNRMVTNLRNQFRLAFRPWSEWVRKGFMQDPTSQLFIAGLRVGGSYNWLHPPSSEGTIRQQLAQLARESGAGISNADPNLVTFRSTTTDFDVADGFRTSKKRQFLCCTSMYIVHRDVRVLPVNPFLRASELQVFPGELETIIDEGQRYTLVSTSFAYERQDYETLSYDPTEYPNAEHTITTYDSERTFPRTQDLLYQPHVLLLRVDPM